ncbi:MAG: hypothetical protein ACYTG5_01020 [Planctomycetota bacterium]|jgi:hypothetical protein
MKWALAGICFALLVALAIGTAAIRAENVLLRARLHTNWQRLFDCRIAHENEIVLWHEVSQPRQLVQYWLALEEARYQ